MNIKLGIDPTTPYLHLGHVVPMLEAKRFQMQGHKVILIIGDFTATIGDPSGRDRTRPLLSEREIDNNVEIIMIQINKVLHTDPELLEVRRNSDWFKRVKLAGLLELTSMVTLSQMTERRDFQNRIQEGNPISMTELIYPILQGYDSVMVKADVEIGGTDQLFNLHMGRDIQKAFGMKQQEIITTPLLTGTDGEKKMSKSYGNSINLLDSAKDMFFKVMSIPDNLIEEYRKLIVPWLITANDPRKDKELLAAMITENFHGLEEALNARKLFYSLVVNKEFETDIVEQSGQLLSEVAVKFLKSKNEFRRLLSQDAIRFNGVKANKDFVLPIGNLEIGKRIKIKIQ